MEPLSATVAAIVTGFLTKGAAALAQQVGEVAADAARTLAQAVLDRLKADPAEERTVERYESDPERQQPALEAAIDQAVTQDEAFATRLQELVATFESSRTGPSIVVGRDATGPIVQGNENQVISGTSGTVTIGDRDHD